MRQYLLLAFIIVFGFQLHAQPYNKAEKKLIKTGKSTEKMSVILVTDKEGERILRTKSTDIPKRGKCTTKKLRKRMLATVQSPEHAGVGIAAPQLGVNRNLILVQRFDKENKPFEAYLNPEIIAKGDSLVGGEEGCLSIPYVRGSVMRFQEITIRYQDRNFKWKEETVTDYTARIFQHEIDHLRGRLFTDYLRYD